MMRNKNSSIIPLGSSQTFTGEWDQMSVDTSCGANNSDVVFAYDIVIVKQ